VVPWLDDPDAEEDEEDEEEGVDLSGLLGGDDTIENGITSGADPSDWDPIEIATRRD
jgi:hypothetical protein